MFMSRKWFCYQNNEQRKEFFITVVVWYLDYLIENCLHLFNHNIEIKDKKWQNLKYYGHLVAASEASSDTISTILEKHARQPTGRTQCRPMTKMLWAGKLVSDDYLSAISAHSKMTVVICITVNSIVLHLLGQTTWAFFFSRSSENHSRIFQSHSNNSAETKKTIIFKSRL